MQDVGILTAGTPVLVLNALGSDNIDPAAICPAPAQGGGGAGPVGGKDTPPPPAKQTPQYRIQPALHWVSVREAQPLS